MSTILLNEYNIIPYILDMKDFPLKARSSVHFMDKEEFSYENNSQFLNFDNIISVWWRRPDIYKIPLIFNPEEMNFVKAECEHYLTGLLWNQSCLWVNEPKFDKFASRKIIQLSYAKKLGLEIPETMITNDPYKAKKFIKNNQKGVIFKRTGASKGIGSETRLVTNQIIENLDSIQNSPTIFQNYIDAKFDLRVICIGDELIPFSIDSQSGTSPVDSRLDNTVKFEKHKLPEEIDNRLRQLIDQLNLKFAAIDMRVGKNGIYYFLEINTAGQFLYLQLKTGIKLMEKLASLLARGDKN